MPLAGEPRTIEGIGRERIVYAPTAGILNSDLAIGDSVSAETVVATIDKVPIRAPIAGTLRGLVRPGIAVLRDDKIVEVDPQRRRRSRLVAWLSSARRSSCRPPT
ncbi:MAG: hypothetical protein ACXWVC_11715 [Rhodoplanes sp.]